MTINRLLQVHNRLIKGLLKCRAGSKVYKSGILKLRETIEFERRLSEAIGTLNSHSQIGNYPYNSK